MRPIVTILTGSHLYGTNIPGSDHDFKVIYVPSARSILLGAKLDEENTLQTQNEIGEHLAQLKQVDTIDVEFIELQKFVRLLMQGQTNTMDMLFAPEDCYVGKPSAEWYTFLSNRERFLSRNCKSFVGYCRDQVRKYVVKQGRYAALQEVVTFLGNVRDHRVSLAITVGLEDFVKRHEQAGFVDIKLDSGSSVRHLDICETRVPLTFSVKEALEIYQIQREKYGRRVSANYQNDSKDWKSMYHAVRVAHEAVELLTTGKLTFPRPERKLLLNIRQGSVIFEVIQELIEEGLAQVEQAGSDSLLPAEPDFEFGNQLVENFYRSEVLGDE